jgi:hypothetical protein
LIATEWKRATVSGEVKREELSEGDIRNVLYASSKPIIEELTTHGDVIEIRGKIRFSGIACRVLAGNEIEYIGIERDVPFCENVNSGSQIPENARFEYSVVSSDMVITVDEEKLYPSATLSFIISAFSEEKQGCLRSSPLQTFRLIRTLLLLPYIIRPMVKHSSVLRKNTAFPF